MKNFLIRVSLAMTLLSASSVSGASPEVSASDPDGLYYLTSPHPTDPYDYRIVLSRDGRAVPRKRNDPTEPTLPGVYRHAARYEFKRLTISSRAISFRTVAVSGISYSFSGTIGSRHDPHLSHPVAFFTGNLKELFNGRVRSTRRLTFSHAVEY